MTTVEDPGLDLGCGHWLRWVAWRPDRDLNPHLAAFPDVERVMVVIRHDLHPDDPQGNCRGRGFCEGVATIDTPVTRQLFAGRLLWELTTEDPVTLSPSLLCHCGDHGTIEQGRWVPT